MAVAVLSLIVLSVIGAGLDFGIRNRIQAHIFAETQRVATDWISSMRPGSTPPPTPESRVNLLQLVDSHNRVVASSARMVGRPPLSTLRPPVDDRVQHRTECSTRGTCVMLTAIRPTPQVAYLLWHGEPHFVYSGRAQPAILATPRLELATAAGIALGVAFAAWTTWYVVGRTLRPVAAIRAKMSEITVSGLSMRVPQPPGHDEIALLARTANQTLARLEEAVEQQRRFASIVSHELRSPVAGLRTQLEEGLLYPDDVDPHDTIRAALSTTERFQAIIDSVLTYARVRTTGMAAPEPIDLAALVKEEVATRSHGTPVSAHVKGDLKVLGDRLQLIGVLNNLVVNAQRHADTMVEVTAESSDDQAVVTVVDDGNGIAPQDRERVFEAFVRLQDGHRRDPGGSGLGLAICREIAKIHNGTLRIEDSPRGARFVLRLPLLPNDRSPAHP